MSAKKLNTWLPLLFATVLAMGIWIGYKIQDKKDGSGSKSSISSSGKLDEVIHYIKNRYKDEVNIDQLEEDAIYGLLKKLDPHSSFISLDEIKAVAEDMNGNFEGIGIEFFIVDDTIMVVTPLSGGPSEALGILTGDKIIYIDDTLVAGTGIKNSGVLKRLKGPKGTEVNVKMKRYGEKDLIPFKIIRDKIPLHSVDVGLLINKKTGYIKINRFSATTYREFMEKLDPLANTHKVRNLIIDVRQNPGGYLQEVVKIIDELLDGRKDIVYTKGNHHPRQNYTARRPGYFEEGNLVVLIDEGSASASEILAGAVQDWDRGTLIGRRTFGKGLVQEQYGLKDGSALRLTVAEYFTPSGRSIQKPYNSDEGNYNEEILLRHLNGELLNKDSISFNDSLIFRTKLEGDRIYGGGGIMPDIFIPLDTTIDPLSTKIYQKGILKRFVYNYHNTNGEAFKIYNSYVDFHNEYIISDDLFNQFLEFCYENGISKDLNKFKKQAYRELTPRMKAHFAKLKWHNEGLYFGLLQEDETFKEAMKVFSNN